MKKSIFTLIVLSLFFSGNIFAQYIVAEDDAGNYTSWETGNNNGFGFSAWDMWITGNAGFFIGSSAGQEFGDIDVDGKSFGMYGNTNLGDYSNAQRLFSNWSDGATFSIDLAVAYRNGSKGIDIFSSGYELIWNFNVGGDNYTAGGVNQSWSYSPTSVFKLTATQNGNDVDILLTRGTDSYSTTITGKSLIGFKLYEGNTEFGDYNNLYFNSLKVSYADPAKVPATANVTIDGDVTLGATQTFTMNNLSIPTGNSFTLESTASGTASLIINGTCTDEIKVERFLTKNDWHFLSSPVVDQPIVGAENFITFTFGNTGTEGDPDVDFYSHDETQSDAPWINIKNPDTTLNTLFETNFMEGKGYLVAYNGNDVTKSFSGTPYTGASFYNLSYTEDGCQGWNLLGNRYQSAFEWKHGSNSFNDVDSSYYYIYNKDMNGGGGGYEYYYSWTKPSTDNANGYIPAMQAFFVRTKTTGSNIVISPFSRMHNDQGFLKSQVRNEYLLTFKISGANYFSKSQIYILDGSSKGADGNDASMLYSYTPFVPHFYSIDGDEKMAANCVPFPVEDYSIPMGLKTGVAGTYTISAEDIQNFNSSIVPILEDTESGMQIDLRFEGSYTFDVAGPGINHSRFILHLKSTVGINNPGQKPQLAVAQIGNALRFYNLEPGDYQLRMVDVMGRVVKEEKLSAEKMIALPESLKAGAYILHLSGSRQQLSRKIVLK